MHINEAYFPIAGMLLFLTCYILVVLNFMLQK